MSKKKTRRDNKKYPDLDDRYTVKLRKDYIDNRHYVNGVKHKGKLVIPPLTEEDKRFLNDFNKEYYNASFDSRYDYNNIMRCEIDYETVMDIKAQIKELKKNRKVIFDKSANKTTDEDREQARYYTKQIEAMEYFLDEMHPRRQSEASNYRRQVDLLNYGKANNMIKSWEILREDELKGISSELLYYDDYEKNED